MYKKEDARKFKSNLSQNRPAKAGTLEKRKAAKVRAKEWPQEEEPRSIYSHLFYSLLISGCVPCTM